MDLEARAAIRRMLIAQLAGERDVLERKAHAVEEQVQNLDPSRDKDVERKSALEIVGRHLRARMRQLSEARTQIVEDEMHEYY